MVCAVCGTPFGAGQAFCVQCGARLPASAPAGPAGLGVAPLVILIIVALGGGAAYLASRGGDEPPIASLSPAAGGGSTSSRDLDEDAKFNAKVVLSTVRVVWLDQGSFLPATAAALQEGQSDFTMVEDGPSTGPTVISVKAVSQTLYRIAVYGLGTCWGVREEIIGPEQSATLYAKRAGTSAGCTATSFADTDFQEHEVVWA